MPCSAKKGKTLSLSRSAPVIAPWSYRVWPWPTWSSIDECLLVDSPHAFDCADVEGILGIQIGWMSCFNLAMGPHHHPASTPPPQGKDRLTFLKHVRISQYRTPYLACPVLPDCAFNHFHVISFP